MRRVKRERAATLPKVMDWAFINPLPLLQPRMNCTSYESCLPA